MNGMRDEITVLKVEPGKPPELVSMANTLQAMQEMVLQDVAAR